MGELRLLLLGALLGCGGRADTGPVGPGSGLATGSSGSGTGSGSTATGSPTAGTVDGERLVLQSGEELLGEVIAVYDQSLWWTAADERWLAVFDPAGSAPWPGDRRLRFVRESDVLAREPAVLERESWTDHLRGLGVHWPAAPLAGVSHVIRGNDGYHLEEDGFGDFAWDLVRTDGSGVRFTGSGTANADYLVWDEPVLAVTGGEVVEVVRTGGDNVPGAYPVGAVNNLVGLRIEGQLYAYYLHFREGSIPAEIQLGAVVQPGDLLGRVGNSGVTLEPHLHLTLHYWSNGVPGQERFWSVPSEWSAGHHAPTPAGSTAADWWVPTTGQWVGAEAF